MKKLLIALSLILTVLISTIGLTIVDINVSDADSTPLTLISSLSLLSIAAFVAYEIIIDTLDLNKSNDAVRINREEAHRASYEKQQEKEAAFIKEVREETSFFLASIEDNGLYLPIDIRMVFSVYFRSESFMEYKDALEIKEALIRVSLNKDIYIDVAEYIGLI